MFSRIPQTRVAHFGTTSKGQIRKTNEDAWGFIIPKSVEENFRKGAVFIISDGVGGHQCGEIASQVAMKAIQGAYYKGPGTETPQDGLERALKWANRAVLHEAANRKDCKGMATTAVAAAIVGKHAYFGYVGDSRAYLFRRGILTPVTEDHSVQVEGEGNGGNPKTMLGRALGVSMDVDVDLLRAEIEPQDRVLLCTDGLTNEVPPDVIEETMRLNPDIRGCSANLLKLANARGGRDNITVVLVRVLTVAGKGG
ncbi:MAG: protein phosphatase 2C domain-containing protein [bacterium]